MSKKKKKKRTVKRTGLQTREKLPFEILPAQPCFRFNFSCTQCGECCHKVENSVALQSIDVFRVARYFKKMGLPHQTPEEVLVQFADPVPLAEMSYPMHFAKTVGDDNACIFLKNNRCSIHESKPTTCKVYPMSVSPNDANDGFDFYMIHEKKNHFCGKEYSAEKWMKAYFDEEDRAFTQIEYEMLPKIAIPLHELYKSGHSMFKLIFFFMKYKFYDYDLDEPFIPQYRRNLYKLAAVLHKMQKMGDIDIGEI